MKRINWLDGWRAIAVMIVISSHLSPIYGWSDAIPGKLGVFIFFAISGYIVTKILLVEQAESNQIDLPHFYVRRSLRILPPLVIYLLTCVVLYWPNATVVFGAARALLFTCNMSTTLGDCGWVFGHTWSLGFEEQFYLILPFVLVGVSSLRSALLFTTALTFASIPFFAPLSFIGRIGFLQIYLLLALGAMYARFENEITPFLVQIPAVLSSLVLVLAGLWTALSPSLVQQLLGLLVAPAVFIGVFALPHRSPVVHWLLASWPFRTLGLYSYTLYLWQQLALTNSTWNVGITPILGLTGALAFSAFSYHTIELICRRTAKKMRHRPVQKNLRSHPRK